MSITSLEKCILDTLAYFQIFNFPLTSWEIYKNLWQPDKKYSFEQIKNTLENLSNNKILGTNEGFYFFKTKGDLVATRKKKYLHAQNKIKKAKKSLWLISHVPFVKAIFICNNLAYQNATEGSDIDLAIICQKNRIWTARFFSTLLMKLLGQRPTENKHQDKICQSFFITTDNLNLESLAYKNDIHFTYWLNQFLPIYGEPKLIEKFFKSNAWTKKHLPNFEPITTNDRWVVKSKSVNKNILELLLGNKSIGGPLNKLLKIIQLKILPKNLSNLAKEDNTNVVISDKILKFHDKDRRIEFRDKWKNKIKDF